MRRAISIFRDGNQMAAMIGPDLVRGLAGFGATAAEAVRDLADEFDRHGYELPGNRVGIEVGGRFFHSIIRLVPGRQPRSERSPAG